jgi:hypothetical protein
MDKVKEELSKIDGVGYLQFQIDTERIITQLDKIIELLELRNSIEVARDQMRNGIPYVISITGGTYPPACNCGDHKSGESTGGWQCPVHGQCF